MTSLVETYTKIAGEFNASRHRIWPCVKDFLDKQLPNSLGIELGSGNGKNVFYRSDLHILGYDFCLPFCQLINDRGNDCIRGDVTQVPFRDNIFDFVMSVAVIHHLDSIDKRIKMITEMKRLVKVGGYIFVSAWALKQDADSNRFFTEPDSMVPWKCRDGITYYRYYHLFIRGELEGLVELMGDLVVINSYKEKGNWIVLYKKI